MKVVEAIRIAAATDWGCLSTSRNSGCCWSAFMAQATQPVKHVGHRRVDEFRRAAQTSCHNVAGRMAFAAVIAAVGMAAAGQASADEGMWPFDEAPLARVRDSLGVTLDSHWLDHLRDASVRLSNGCSASIVSHEGLVLTNQHCVVACAGQLSTPGKDFVRDGFIAAARGEERACPGIQAEVLVAITDVTQPIFAAGAGKLGEDFANARQTAIATAERDACAGDPRFRCQVISFYEGGQFKVYKFRRYADVRLVFAPEMETALFGGDPDNFNFPRFDLDCAFLRLYDDGKPATTPDFLAWSTAPPEAGEPVFVSGSPATTERQLTVAQLSALRDVALPMLSVQEAELRGRLIELSEQSPDMARIVAGPLFEDENTLKVLQGRLLAALSRSRAFMAAREQEEGRRQGRGWPPRPSWRPRSATPGTDIVARAEKTYALQFVVWHELEASTPGGGSERDPLRHACWLRAGRGAGEARQRPAPVRIRRLSRLPLDEKAVLDDRPVQPVLERLYLEFWLSKTRELLGPDAAAVTMVRSAGESPEHLGQEAWSPARGSATLRCARRSGTAA